MVILSAWRIVACKERKSAASFYWGILVSERTLTDKTTLEKGRQFILEEWYSRLDLRRSLESGAWPSSSRRSYKRRSASPFPELERLIIEPNSAFTLALTFKTAPRTEDAADRILPQIAGSTDTACNCSSQLGDLRMTVDATCTRLAAVRARRNQ